MNLTSPKMIVIGATVFATLVPFVIAVGDERNDNLHITAIPVLPLNGKDPEILLRYSNADANKDLKLLLPKEPDEVLVFREIAVSIDGKRPEYVTKVDTLLINPSRSRWEVIKPGRYVDLRIKLSQIYQIPTQWSRLEISAVQICGIKARLVGHLVVERRNHE